MLRVEKGNILLLHYDDVVAGAYSVVAPAFFQGWVLFLSLIIVLMEKENIFFKTIKKGSV